MQWIITCASWVSYSLVLNGEPLPYFEAKRGLRQGDPVSPLLFVVVMEYLNRLLKQATHSPHFRSHPGCKELDLNCLAFADDVLVFCKGQEVSVRLVTQALVEFEKVPGLAANPMKSRIYVGGLELEKTRNLCHITGFQLGEFPMKYLGFPLLPGSRQKRIVVT